MATIEHVSDTARWAAMFRAMESERDDALFRDPFARKLAGVRGEEVYRSLPFHRQHAWSWVMRTVIFDRIIEHELQSADMVINLAAGLDARPYRMRIPPGVTWVEADLPAILDYKESVLANDTPHCPLERVRIDLSQNDARRDLLAQLAARTKRALIISEGLLIYLTSNQAAGLADELAAHPSFARWLMDLTSPGLLKMLQKNTHQEFATGATPLQFGPADGPKFFEPHGWTTVSCTSFLKEAGKMHRLPSLLMRMFSLLPGGFPSPKSNRPWGGACLLARRP